MSLLTFAKPSRALDQRVTPTGAGRLFRNAPQSLAAFVAALLEPAVSAATLVGVHMVWDEPFGRPSLLLLLLALTLTFPGSARFRDAPVAAAMDIAVGWCWLIALLLMCGYATASLDLFPSQMLVAWALATPVLHWFAVMAGRGLLQRSLRQASATRRVIVVGGGQLGVRAAQALGGRDEVDTTLLGYFDDRSAERLAPEAASARLGSFAAVAAYVQAHAVDDVYITLPLGTQPRIVALLESLQGTTASIYFVPDIFGISVIQGRLQDVNGVAVVGLCETPFTGVNAAVKRGSDIVLASLILLLIAPVMLAVAVGVRASGPGPVIFRQRRNGLGGDEIVVYKFRSMRSLDDGNQVRQATRGDARITRFGAFIRRTSLAELPQFVNVLQGRMSIVGPRPHAVAHNNAYRQAIKAYMVRHKVRPGLTGWAQVNGHRGETDTLDKMRARVEYDLEYLRNWSLALDLEIILRTVRLVVSDRAAH